MLNPDQPLGGSRKSIQMPSKYNSSFQWWTKIHVEWNVGNNSSGYGDNPYPTEYDKIQYPNEGNNVGVQWKLILVHIDIDIHDDCSVHTVSAEDRLWPLICSIYALMDGWLINWRVYKSFDWVLYFGDVELFIPFFYYFLKFEVERNLPQHLNYPQFHKISTHIHSQPVNFLFI